VRIGKEVLLDLAAGLRLKIFLKGVGWLHAWEWAWTVVE
jgi:hypothetical protein